MRGLALLLLVGACGADLDVRVERQAGKLAQATDAGWQTGSVVEVGTPGSATFPQYVALRISLVKHATDDEAAAMPLPIESVSLELHGLSAGDFSIEPTCALHGCTAELTVLEAGTTMIEVVATGADASASDCFYYAVHEDPDPALANRTLRTELDTQQRTCRTELQSQ